MTGKRRALIAGLAATIVLAALAGQARVFQRVGGIGNTLFRAELVGRSIYEKIMQINGGEASVTIAASTRGVAALRDSLATGGGAIQYKADDGVGVGRLEGGGRMASVLAFTPSLANRSIVVAVEQSAAERDRSRDPAQAEGATGIPGLPGSTLTLTLRNGDTRTALESRRTAVAPSVAAAYYDTTLRRSGWTRLLPRAAGDTGFMLYVKESEVCCVHVRAGDPRGDCLVTVLRKPGAAQ